MKLGKETANVHNWIMSGYKVTPIEEVKEGMDVTFLLWTDRTTGVVRRVDKDCGYVIVERYEDCYDRCEPLTTTTDGFFIVLKYTRGRWYESVSKGSYFDYDRREQVFYGEQLNKTNVLFGVRDGYYDESF